MSHEGHPPLTRSLLRLLGPALAGGLTDAQLLERFVAHQEEAAFEILLWRHGPKVLGVCRGILRHEQEAENAFQATELQYGQVLGNIAMFCADPAGLPFYSTAQTGTTANHYTANPTSPWPSWSMLVLPLASQPGVVWP